VVRVSKVFLWLLRCSVWLGCCLGVICGGYGVAMVFVVVARVLFADAV